MILHASSEVKTAYRIMRVPPAVQLYDLKADPHAFVNLSAMPNMRTFIRITKQAKTMAGDDERPC